MEKTNNKDLRRDTFIIYRSFYEAMQPFDNDIKAKLFDAMCEFSLNGEDVELEGVVASLFTLMRPNLEANNKRYLNGSKAKRKQNGSKTEANTKQNGSKHEANKDKDKDKDNNKDKDKDKDKNKKTNKKVDLPYKSEKFKKAWDEWKEYKRLEHNFRYKSAVSEKTNLTSLTRLGSNEDECIAIIYQSIERGWKGFFELRESIVQKESTTYETETIDGVLYELRENPKDPFKGREKRRPGDITWAIDTSYEKRAREAKSET